MRHIGRLSAEANLLHDGIGNTFVSLPRWEPPQVSGVVRTLPEFGEESFSRSHCEVASPPATSPGVRLHGERLAFFGEAPCELRGVNAADILLLSFS
jgi:hypothetical protein